MRCCSTGARGSASSCWSPAFAAYVFGLADPHVPLDRLPELWIHPVGRYLAETGSPTGWGWLALLHRGDIAGLVGIAILAGCSRACLLALVPMYLRDGDRAFAALCLARSPCSCWPLRAGWRRALRTRR